MFFELSLCVRLTRPCVSSSFNRREIVVDDDSTNFFKSENRVGSFFRSNTSKICIDLDLLNSSSNVSTRP